MIRTIIILILFNHWLISADDPAHHSSGSMQITSQKIILDRVKLHSANGNLDELDKNITIVDGIPAIPLANLASSIRFELTTAAGTSVIGIRTKALIRANEKNFNALVLTYLSEGQIPLHKVHDLDSVARDRWTTFTIWLSLPAKKSGFHFTFLNFDATVSQNVFISKVERIEAISHGAEPLHNALKKYPSLFRQTWSQSILACIILLGFFSIIKLSKKRISFLFLSGFLIPPFVALGFLLICAFAPLQNMIHARILDAETALTAHLARVIGLQDKVDKRFQRDLGFVTAKIQTFLEKKRSTELNSDPDQSLLLNLEELNALLEEIKVESGQKLVLTDGDYTAFTNAEDDEKKKEANYVRAIRKLLFPSYKQISISQLEQTIQKSRDTILEFRKVLMPNRTSEAFLEDFFNNPGKLNKLEIKTSQTPWGDFGGKFWSFFNEPKTGILWLLFGGLSREKLREYFIVEYDQSNLLQAIPELSTSAKLDYYISSFSRGFNPFPRNNANQGYFDLLSQLARTNQESIFRHSFDNGRFFIYLASPMEKYQEITLTLRLDATFILEGLAETENRVYFATLLIITILTIFSFSLSKGATMPILAITKGLKKIRDGDLSSDLEVSGRDQFAVAARLFNHLIQKLREKEKISKFLSQMALRSLQTTERVATRQEATVFFCGIINIDTFLKDSDLAYRLTWISKFLNLIENHLQDSGGFLDKFTGRAALALYLEAENQKSVLSGALNLRSNFEQLNQELMAEGLQPFEIGIGIASGVIVLGPIGSSKRRDYTAIGATVNMAARLHYQAQMGTNIRIHLDETTYHRFQNNTAAKFKKISDVRIKGYSESQCIYEVL